MFLWRKYSTAAEVRRLNDWSVANISVACSSSPPGLGATGVIKMWQGFSFYFSGTVGSPRDCHKRSGQWITQSQRMKTAQPGDVNLKDILYPLVTGRKVRPALTWLTLDGFNGWAFSFFFLLVCGWWDKNLNPDSRLKVIYTMKNMWSDSTKGSL